MITRIATATVALLIFVPLLIWGDPMLVTGVFALLCALAAGELLSCVGLLGKLYISIPSIALSFACVMSLCFLEDTGRYLVYALGAALVLSVYYLMVISVIGNKKGLQTENLLLTYAVMIYTVCGFAGMAIIYNLYLPVLWAVFASAWVTDTFAYFSGVLLGKHKLCPEISPKKTVEGAIGGVIGCIIACSAGAAIVFGQAYFGNILFIIAVAVCALLLSVLSQFGDLFASLIKRRYGKKDYGNLFPGHGGVLDRFDSLIPTATLLCVVCVASEALGWIKI